MIDHVDFFENGCNINASQVAEAKCIANHMHETGEAEDALVWLLDELDSLVHSSRKRGLDAYAESLEEEDDSCDWLWML